MGKGMRAGKKPKTGGGGAGNMQKQLQQMQAMQRQMCIRDRRCQRNCKW